MVYYYKTWCNKVSNYAKKSRKKLYKLVDPEINNDSLVFSILRFALNFLRFPCYVSLINKNNLASVDLKIFFIKIYSMERRR